MKKKMAGNGRTVSRQDLQDGIDGLGTLVDTKIEGLGTLVDAKFDRVLDKVEGVRADIQTHVRAVAETTKNVEQKLDAEVTRIDSVHEVFRLDFESLKKYRWTLVGAIAILGIIAEFLTHVVFK